MILLLFGMGTSGGVVRGQGEKKFEDFDKVVDKAKIFEGLFKLYQKDDHVYAELQSHQLDRMFMVTTALAKGMGMGGHTLNSDEQWVITFKRVGDKIHLIRRNVHFKAASNLPVARAVETTYTDSVLMSLRIKTINPMKGSVLIDFNEIFHTNFAMVPFGAIDPSRTTWNKVKAFPRNVELQVSATFFGGRRGGDDNVIDPRGNTVILHYGILELPEPGFQPRLADDRVGYFLTATKDFSNDNKDTSYVRLINRWRMERADGSTWKEGAKLVPPKKRIVYWIEKSVPDEYRAAVREGILEWNKAFEKIGFRDAIEVRQQENEDFDPEDASYSTFRWIASDVGFAMGPSRVNPLTGEIFDADIIFDASMVRYYKGDQTIYRNDKGQIEEPASMIQATRRGWLIPDNPLLKPLGWEDQPQGTATAKEEYRSRFNAFRNGLCQCSTQKSSELSMALAMMAARLNMKPGEKMPDEMIQQAVKETTMHEVGHTLGLRHNFKASTMLKNEELHDLAITRKRGLVGSVMDYNPVNIAPKGTKQGDFFTTTIGPYDYWAIEYGYKPLSGGTEGETTELQKIAGRCAEPGLVYGTDEDMMNADPHVNVWDLGSDTMKYAQDRILLAEELIKHITERVVEKGEGYQRARTALNIMLRQYADGAYLVAKHVGGEYYYRDHKEDPNARDPIEVVKGAKQREGLAFLQKHILTDTNFNLPPELLRKLGADRWMHWGNEIAIMRGVDYSVPDRVLGIQRVVLRELLDADTLKRVQEMSSKVDAKDEPLQVSEIFKCLTESIFSDLPSDKVKTPSVKSTGIRRNLQREYLANLTRIVLRGGVPADARSLARSNLKTIATRIELALKDKGTDETTSAHLDEVREQIAKTLSASLNASGN